MLLTNHVLSGALIGALARRPVAAFAPAWPRSSRSTPCRTGEWGSQRRFLRVAVPDGLISLATMGAIAAASPPIAGSPCWPA